ncbi:winged helix-turn-helix transcriptional regulator [Bradyrhizobium sp. INPA01-394B]|uniref:Winged helix-turn-helix transcriptional regulator n=1 Tax=Bradyrhizobium campsiandrae TaxID=1729892 RepID=A0ABR7U3F4_9BRAD|nr:MarR family winged helix-turn-helix transcriptional regulator [Bradyrhizobium campsiandrae]MBC9879908.1 winged helix-turn-helix transcriptional regulator [Bradyrhizobium campsiandrae]MBC9978593.1 winged helix-turn-helix transcriptional regulator [Bradyrhizobium campsiandrae]
MYTDCYCTQLRRASSGVTKIYDDALRAQGLRITQFSMLRGLQRLGQATLSELSEELALDRTTMSRGVKMLIDAGWVDATTGETDAREKILRLNERGKKKLSDAIPSWSKAQAKVEAHMKQHLKSTTEKRLIEALLSLQFSD